MSDGYEWSDAAGFAEFYETYFVPALFGDWSDLTVAAANLKPDDKVLDVACGTGVVAKRAFRVTNNVVGLDLNGDMLSVARNSEPKIEWRQGDASNLEFGDKAFDVVFCQFALMFFPDAASALKEMARVANKLVVTVWESLPRSPGYREFVDLLRRERGEQEAAILSSPFALGNKVELLRLFAEAGLTPEIETKRTIARFPSIASWVTTDIRATPLSDMFDDVALNEFIHSAENYLSQYSDDAGEISFPAPAHIAICSYSENQPLRTVTC